MLSVTKLGRGRRVDVHVKGYLSSRLPGPALLHPALQSIFQSSVLHSPSLTSPVSLIMSLLTTASRVIRRSAGSTSKRRLATTSEPVGLSFSLTEEQAGIQGKNPSYGITSTPWLNTAVLDLARKFSRESIVPVAAEYDRTMVCAWSNYPAFPLRPPFRNIHGQSSKRRTRLGCSTLTYPKP